LRRERSAPSSAVVGPGVAKPSVTPYRSGLASLISNRRRNVIADGLYPHEFSATSPPLAAFNVSSETELMETSEVLTTDTPPVLRRWNAMHAVAQENTTLASPPSNWQLRSAKTSTPTDQRHALVERDLPTIAQIYNDDTENVAQY